MVCEVSAVEAASPIVRALCAQKMGMFACFRDIGLEDLYQEVMKGVLVAMSRPRSRFNHRKARFATWVGMITTRRLIDVGRHRGRQAKREAHYAEANWGTEPVTESTPLDILTADEPGEPQPLADWLGTIYSLAKRALGGKHRHGRHFFNLSQVLCVGLLMERESLSVIDVRELFEQRPDLAKACRFMHVPSLSWFRDAAELSGTYLARPGVREALASFEPTLSETV